MIIEDEELRISGSQFLQLSLGDSSSSMYSHENKSKAFWDVKFEKEGRCFRFVVQL